MNQPIRERYQRRAVGYDRYWAPVLRPTALRLLDLVAERIGEAPAGTVVDLGTGTGTLAIGAAGRWAGAEVIGLDLSPAMLAVAASRADEVLSPEERARLRFLEAPAAGIPLEDGSVDVVLSSYVLQLVPDRRAVLAEVLRILRPGGLLAFVTWLARGDAFAPDDEFDSILDELDVPEAEEPDDDRAGPFASPDAAARQLRGAGFRRVSVRGDELVHPFTPESYLEFLESYEERELFDELEADRRARLHDRTLERFRALAAGDFLWRAPIVVSTAIRPPSSDRA